MKTSELIAIATESPWSINLTEDELDIATVGRVSLKAPHIFFYTGYEHADEKRVKVLKAMVEYAGTPINKRGKLNMLPKKYCIRLNQNFLESRNSMNYLKHLYKNEGETGFYFSDNQEYEGCRVWFTERQIAEFPLELRKAIECEFLILWEEI